MGRAAQEPAAGTKPAEQGGAGALYRRLSAVGLDPERVYVVREGYLDREDVRILLQDGTLAFLQEVDGRITGAFFEGEGELLIMPPDRTERDSLGLFTGIAVLQEHFTSAFFRFNDDAFTQLQPALRRRLEAAEGEAFVAPFREPVQTLAEGDALRLLRSFLNAGPGAPVAEHDRMLRAHLAGRRLGIFEVYFDTLLREQVWAGQTSYAEGTAYFDRWLAFPMRSVRRLQEAERRLPPAARRARPVANRAEDSLARVSAYRLRSQVHPPEHLDVEAELTLEALFPGQRVVIFELSRFLQVRSVEAEGAPLEFVQNEAVEGTELSRRGNDLLAVVFPQALPLNQPVTLRLRYGGAVMSEAGGGLLHVGARGAWYPNLGLAPAAFDLEFRHPAGWTLVATGEHRSERTEGDWRIARWTTSRPIPIAGFNLGRYERASARAGDVRVETYAARAMEHAFQPPPRAVLIPRPTPRNPRAMVIAVAPPLNPRPARNAQMVAEQAARTVNFLSARIAPFPFPALTLSQMPGGDSQGWPTLVFLSSYAFLTPEEKAALRWGPYEAALYGRLVLAHEVAHQWWGDTVLWQSYRDQWLLEALANYSALLQIESEDRRAFDVILEQYRQELLRKAPSGALLLEAGPVTLGLRLSSSRFPRGYDVVSYGRGTWLLHMLRHMVNDAARQAGQKLPQPGAPDEPFVRLLRRTFERFQTQPLSTAAFREMLEEDLPQPMRYEGRDSLDWFFEEWVEGTAVPALELAGVRISQQDGKLVATGRIRQQHAPESIVTSVPLWAETPQGRRFVARVFAQGEESGFRLEVPAGTRRLLLDPEKTLLRR
jgi:hypothetical protein